MTATATQPWTTARHPLARLLRSVACGQPPQADGAWMRVSPWIPTVQAVVAFPGHAVLAVSYDVTDEDLLLAGVDSSANAFSARTVTTLAGPKGWIGPSQVVHCAVGSGTGQAGRLTARSDLGRHAGVMVARRTLQDVQVMAAGWGSRVLAGSAGFWTRKLLWRARFDRSWAGAAATSRTAGRRPC